MRTHRLASIPTPTLADVTGGCHKHGPPPEAMQQPEAAQGSPRVQVQVATGQQGGQAIQQALSGGAFSAS